MNTRKTVNRSATDRLKHLVRAELTRQELSDARAAREARLPGSVFRADELCTALGISMTIGVDDPLTDIQRGKSATDN